MDDLHANAFTIKEGLGEAKPNRGARLTKKKSKVNDVI
jgi:hypothetical protein